MELSQYIKQTELNLSRHIIQIINNKKKHLEHVASYYKFKQPSLLYDQQIQKKDDFERQLNLSITTKLNNALQKVELLTNRINLKDLKQQTLQGIQSRLQLHDSLNKSIINIIDNSKKRLSQRIENLNSLSPSNTMLRGYTIVNKMSKLLQVHSH